ncbi:MAG TPA: recombinase family protein [Bryobacteraceae bacterium]
MKDYYAYVRVSTAKQGEHGSSLQEQRDAIRAFAVRNNLNIAAWFEERETAAKLGRREFARMIAALHKRKASGVIFHKIDRSARNLRDWSAIQDLADEGIDVRFTQESVNLGSNEGKLTGDFLAVISAHYIRNLRDEVKKGMRGRLKQGLYPLRAPIGYLDQGGGKPKTSDPERAPFIREAFELYGSGALPLRALAQNLYRRGLRGCSGKKLGYNRIAEILRNPFYSGVILMKRSGETYPGVHEPLIATALYQKVQMRLNGKLNTNISTHDFTFRRMIKCNGCKRHLVGEKQKGHIYYRCHDCQGHSIREEAIEAGLWRLLSPLCLTPDESDEIRQLASEITGNWVDERAALLNSLRLQIDAVRVRLTRLTDIYIDAGIDKNLFEERKLGLLMERRLLEEQLGNYSRDETAIQRRVDGYLELLKGLRLSYSSAIGLEKRKLICIS